MIDDAAFRFAVFAAPREEWATWVELGRTESAAEALACAAGFAERERQRPKGYLTIIMLVAESPPSVRLHEAGDDAETV